MSERLRRARDLVEGFERSRSGAVELAVLASLAVRVEPELLRLLRLRLAPHLDAATEADLWFSPLVQARGHDGIAFSAEVAEVLRDRLREDPRLTRAWEITRKSHEEISPSLLLEERVTWLALTGATGAALDEALAPALSALVREGRTGLAPWAARALPHLPPEARSTRAAWLLSLAASQTLEGRAILEDGPPGDLLDEDFAEILSDLKEADLVVRRDGEELELGDVRGEGAFTIRVADTMPRLVEIRSQARREVLAVSPGRSARRWVGAGAVRLRGLNGAVYELRGWAPVAEDPEDGWSALTNLSYQDFSIWFEQNGMERQEFLLFVNSPAGSAEDSFRIPLEQSDLDQLAEISSRETRDLEEIGKRLFHALFPGPVLNLFVQSVGQAEAQNSGLRIRLCFSSWAPDHGLLLNLPWEVLFWEERNVFLSLSRRTPVIRSLDAPVDPRPRQAFQSRLRVLVIVPHLENAARFNDQEEVENIQRILASSPSSEVTVLRRATTTSLRAALLRQRFNVLHFIGHGTFSRDTGEGILIFEDDRISGSALGKLLEEFSSLRLVFLSAAYSANVSYGEKPGILEGIVTRLILAGVPAVLAMRGNVFDRAAIEFSRTFYQALSNGLSLDDAVTTGRLALQLMDLSSSWASPVLFLQREGGGMIDRLQPAGEVRKEIIDFSRFIEEKTVGFVGRSWVFDAINAFLLQSSGGYILMEGSPGIGKSAILAELVRRESYFHHFFSKPSGVRTRARFLRNLSAQIIIRFRLQYSSLPPNAGKNWNFLLSLLEEVLVRRLEKRIVLIVDGVDEAETEDPAEGENLLGFPAALPLNVFVVASARQGGIRSLQVDRSWRLSLDQTASENITDLHLFVESWLARPKIQKYLSEQNLDDKTFLDLLVSQSEGNFEYLRYVLPEIESGAYQDRSLQELPIGLANYYEDHWRRLHGRNEDAWFKYKLPVLVALTVVREPLSVDIISKFAGIEERRLVLQTLEEWKPFLATVLARDTQGLEEKRYSLYHESFYRFILGKEEVADERIRLKAAHDRILNSLTRLSE
jgi:CHAT domain/NACHT domain